jgi:hypothetical protein
MSRPPKLHVTIWGIRVNAERRPGYRGGVYHRDVGAGVLIGSEGDMTEAADWQKDRFWKIDGDGSWWCHNPILVSQTNHRQCGFNTP